MNDDIGFEITKRYLKREALVKGFSDIEADSLIRKYDDLYKAWSTDLMKQFPNGSWRTINGARVFIDGGKVVAGLNNFNGKIEDFFKEKRQAESKPETKSETSKPAKSELDTAIENWDAAKLKDAISEKHRWLLLSEKFGEKAIAHKTDNELDKMFKEHFPEEYAHNQRIPENEKKIESELKKWGHGNNWGRISDHEINDIARIRENIEKDKEDPKFIENEMSALSDEDYLQAAHGVNYMVERKDFKDLHPDYQAFLKKGQKILNKGAEAILEKQKAAEQQKESEKHESFNQIKHFLDFESGSTINPIDQKPQINFGRIFNQHDPLQAMTDIRNYFRDHAKDKSPLWKNQFDIDGFVGEIKDRDTIPLPTQNKIKKVKPVSHEDALKGIVSSDKLHPVMNGIHHDPEGYKVATDAFKLIAVKTDVGENSGKIIDPKTGQKVDGRYPDYKSIIPTSFENMESNVDLGKLHANTEYANKLGKMIERGYGSSMKINPSIPQIFDPKIINETVDSLRKLGVTHADFHFNDDVQRPIVIKGETHKGEEVTALVLPKNPEGKPFQFS